VRRIAVSVDAGPVRARLARLAGDAEREAALAVAREAGALADAARALAPVAGGTLRRSIAARAAEGGLGAVVGSDAAHAPFVELGTARQPERPFLGPAWQAARAAVRASLAAAVLRAAR